MLTKINRFSNGMASQAFNILVKNSLTFKKTYGLLQKSQWWSADQLEEYQLEQLSKLLDHAYMNVPYYTRIFDERGLKPKDIQDLKDLEKLPFLTKDMVRANFKDLCASNYSPGRFQLVNTGGSTGTPLELYLEKGVTDAKEWAFIKTQWDRVGYRFRDKCAIFRGYKVPVSKDSFWKSQLFGRWMLFSSYDINNLNTPAYIQKLKEYDPKFVQAYPSSLSLLAMNMKELNVSNPFNIKAILCGSENLFPTQRKILEHTFNTRVYSWYGLTEKVVLAGECEVSNNYHIFPEYGITELIDEGGNVICSGSGEIVGTGFNNYSMPLIRYRTGDMGVLSRNKCECGREYPLFERVEGRSQDYVVTKDDSKITLTALIFGQHFEAFSNIKELQLIQEQKGVLLFNIVKTEDYSEVNENELLSKIKEVSQNNLDVYFNYVDSIPKTERGKHKFLIQKL
jgi:phenylacetate-CoA ligase